MKLIASHLSGSRARLPLRNLPLPVLFALVLAAGAMMVAGCSGDKESATFPKADPPPEMNWLFAVYGTDANNVYAAGNRGAMFHFDGTSWSAAIDMESATPITDIWGPGDGTLLACGHEGKIWRNTNGAWSSMSSGTSHDLYALGDYQGDTYAAGRQGTLRVLNGNSWSSTNTDSIIVRNLVDKAPLDTLRLNDDIYSITTVNYYFFGGAFEVPEHIGEPVGMLGTDGMILGEDEPPLIGDPPVLGPQFDWWLRTLRGDQLADSEWVLTTTSDGTIRENNYLGTSEGWLFQLKEDLSGLLVWDKFYPDMTVNPGAGIRDIWLDENDNLFMVTDEGDVVFQTHDYDFDAGDGTRKVVYNGQSSLTSIWGADTDHIFFVGLIENTIFQGTMDFSEILLDVTEIPVDFPVKGKSIDPFTDELGRPRF